MAPKRANPKADEAAKAALLAARKGKALALTQSTHQEPTEDNVPRTCEDDTLRTCGPEGQLQQPSGFAQQEGADLTEDGEVLGVSTEEQLQLRALRLKNRNLQRQKEILEAKRQRLRCSEKCVFGVRQGKILGYLVSHRGIEANPTKIQAIVDMSPPQSARDVQRLTGRLAALNRFISRSAERSLPFLKTLRGAKDFAWGPEMNLLRAANLPVRR